MLQWIMRLIAEALRYAADIAETLGGGPEPEAEPAPTPKRARTFSREQREAERRREGGSYEARGTHGGLPQDAGRTHKDREARPHK